MIGGIDEAGRGPVMGPMVVAGVAVDDEAPLLELGVKDSKRIAPAKRVAMARHLLDNHRTKVIVVPAVEIDSMRTQMTMNQLEVYLFTSVAKALDVNELFLDAADANEKEFGQAIARGLSRDTYVVSRHKGDDLFPIVSAASIVAKTRRDQEVERISAELGEDIGSGYPSDQKTIGFMRRYIERNGELPPYTRKSWKTATRLLGEASQTKLM